MAVTIVGHDGVKRSIDDTLDELLHVVNEGMKVSRMPDGSFVPGYDPFTALKSLSDTDGGINGMVKGFVKDACTRAEKVGPMCSNILIQFAINLLSDLRDLEMFDEPLKSINSQTIKRVNALIDSISKNARPVTHKSMRSIIQSITNDTQLTSMIIETIKLAGSECKIIIEPTPAITSSVERTGGYAFTVTPDPSFYQDGKWSEENVKCIVIDGIVETVAEVDTLFQRCHEENQPMIIFARGFKDDVLNTMRVNRARRTLNVMPVNVAFDLQSVNILNDVATVIGTDVISALKGELISTICFDDVQVVERVTCLGSTVNIENSSTKHEVQHHAETLQEKRDRSTVDDVSRVLNARIRSLAASSVIMRVAQSSIMEGTRSLEAIDVSLRVTQSLLQHGSISSKDLHHDLLPDFGVIPATTLVACVKFGSSLVMALLNTGCAVISDLGEPDVSLLEPLKDPVG